MENILINGVHQGLIFAFMALGVLLTFEILGFPDMTVEGTFPLGAAITATFVVEGVEPIFAVLLGALAGSIAGAATGIIHTRLKINNILAGILTTSIIYTVMLRAMGRPNTSLLAYENFFTQIQGFLGLDGAELTVLANQLSVITILLVMVLAVAFLLGQFLKTDLGLTIRATGSNEKMIRALGVNTDNTKILTLVISNFLVAFSGALASQSQGFADVGMGIGVLVAAIASVIIGEIIFGSKNISVLIVSAVLGSCLYRALLALGLRLNFPAEDFKAVTAILVILSLSLPTLKKAKKTLS